MKYLIYIYKYFITLLNILCTQVSDSDSKHAKSLPSMFFIMGPKRWKPVCRTLGM